MKLQSAYFIIKHIILHNIVEHFYSSCYATTPHRSTDGPPPLNGGRDRPKRSSKRGPNTRETYRNCNYRKKTEDVFWGRSLNLGDQSQTPKPRVANVARHNTNIICIHLVRANDIEVNPGPTNGTKCNKCGNTIASNIIPILCASCNNQHHLTCSKVTRAEAKRIREKTMNWYCPLCTEPAANDIADEEVGNEDAEPEQRPTVKTCLHCKKTINSNMQSP